MEHEMSLQNKPLFPPVFIDGVPLPTVYDVELDSLVCDPAPADLGTVTIKYDGAVQIKRSDLVSDAGMNWQAMSRKIKRHLNIE
jgi:hypothetical protein